MGDVVVPFEGHAHVQVICIVQYVQYEVMFTVRQQADDFGVESV